jgi:hypothetical protein
MLRFHKFFENKYQKPKPDVDHWHREVIPNSGGRKKGNIMADYLKTDPSKNQKIEQLRDGHGKKVCFPADLDYIKSQYKVIPFKGEVKKLGSTGIKLYFDSNLNKFVIER